MFVGHPVARPGYLRNDGWDIRAVFICRARLIAQPGPGPSLGVPYHQHHHSLPLYQIWLKLHPLGIQKADVTLVCDDREQKRAHKYLE